VAGLDLPADDPLLFDEPDCALEPEDAGCCTKGLVATTPLLVLVW